MCHNPFFEAIIHRNMPGIRYWSKNLKNYPLEKEDNNGFPVADILFKVTLCKT